MLLSLKAVAKRMTQSGLSNLIITVTVMLVAGCQSPVPFESRTQVEAIWNDYFHFVATNRGDLAQPLGKELLLNATDDELSWLSLHAESKIDWVGHRKNPD